MSVLSFEVKIKGVIFNFGIQFYQCLKYDVEIKVLSRSKSVIRKVDVYNLAKIRNRKTNNLLNFLSFLIS
mgnify:FL=1